MWAVAIAYLTKNAAQLAISLAITLLEKSGYLAKWDADGIRLGTHVLKTVENVKTYSSPSDFPGQVHANGV